MTSLLVTGVLLAPILGRSTGRHLLTPLVLLGASLVTFKAVLLLPVLWLSALLQERRPALREFLPYGVACGLGLILAHALWPERVWAQGSNLLVPLLGWRWLPNLAWVLISMLGVAAVWPRHFPARWKQRAPGGGLLALGTGVWLVLLGLGVRFVGLGWEPAAGHLIWSALPFLALGALQRGWRPRRFSWLALALVLTGLHLFPYLQTEPRRPGPERLLAPPSGADGAALAQVPGLRHYTSAEMLQALLRQEARHPGSRPLKVLAPQDTDRPWLERLPDDTPGAALFLFHPERFPSPRVLFSSKSPPRRAGPCTGLHDDGVWTRDRFTLEYTLEKTGPTTLEIRRRGWRPAVAGPLLPRMTVRLDGRPLELLQAQKTLTRWQIPPDGRAPGPHRLEISAPTFVPRRDVPGATDQRVLGVDLKEIVLR